MLPQFGPWERAEIRTSARVAEDQFRVALRAPEALVGAYRRAGQFVRARVGTTEPGIFAMMSAPSERELVLLLRTGNPDGGETADAIAALGVGDTLDVTAPAGAGFALERAEGRPVFVVATGTAIGPARAAIHTMLETPQRYGPIALDHGLRSEAHLAIRGDLARWKTAGVDVVVHFSQPIAGGAVEGVLAHDALLSRIDDATLRSATFVVVGQTMMVEEMRARVVLRGGKDEHVLHNY